MTHTTTFFSPLPGRTLALALTFVAAATLSACAPGGTRDAPMESYTAEELYKRGELILEGDGKPKEALRYFEEVERIYPYTEWAKRALIMQAFSQHKPRNHVRAVGLIQHRGGQQDDIAGQMQRCGQPVAQNHQTGRRCGEQPRHQALPALQRLLVRALGDKQELAFSGGVTVMKIIGG